MRHNSQWGTLFNLFGAKDTVCLYLRKRTIPTLHTKLPSRHRLHITEFDMGRHTLP